MSCKASDIFDFAFVRCEVFENCRKQIVQSIINCDIILQPRDLNFLQVCKSEAGFRSNKNFKSKSISHYKSPYDTHPEWEWL